MAKQEFRLASSHPHTEDLANGRIVAPGETVRLSAEEAGHPHNKRLIDEVLIATSPEAGDPVLTGEALKRRADELDIKGRTQMTADELRKAIAEQDNGGSQ